MTCRFGELQWLMVPIRLIISGSQVRVLLGPPENKGLTPPTTHFQTSENRNCAHFCAQPLIKLCHEAAFLVWALTAAGSGLVEMASRARRFASVRMWE